MHAKWILVVALGMSLVLLGGVALAQEGAPQGVQPTPVQPTPAQPGGLWIKLELPAGRSAYALGEHIRLAFTINQPAYVYIFDIPPNQQVLNIFPNQYSALSKSMPLPAGQYVLPDNNTYNLTVTETGGLGREYFGAIASKKPLKLAEAGRYVLGAVLGKNAASFQSKVQAAIQGVEPTPNQNVLKEYNIAVITIQTYKKPTAVPKQARLLIKSTPAARLIIDGQSMGYTLADEFRQIPLNVGKHQISLYRAGCQPYIQTINLKEGDERFFDVTLNYLPLPYFTALPHVAHVGDAVCFNAYESEDRDGTIEKYEWDFDSDGQIDATGLHVDHVFTSAGTYTVTLIVSDDKGAKNQATETVRVLP